MWQYILVLVDILFLVIIMKKYLFTILLAVLLGVVLEIYSFNKFQEEEESVSSNNKSIYAFQLGVFSDFTNANNVAQKYGALLILDGNKYRVYLGLTINRLNDLKKIFDDKGISYYIRSIDVSNDYYNYLIDKEKFITSDNYKEVLKDILKDYERSL